MRRKDMLDFPSYDGKITAKIGSGDRCVVVYFAGEMRGGIVLDDEMAEQLGRNLIRLARNSRRPLVRDDAA